MSNIQQARQPLPKISEKKNWGLESKGISSHIIAIDKFSKGGVMDNYHISSFLKRDGIVYEYGEDSPVLTYNYFYEKLHSWIIDKLNTQKDSGPLEDLSTHIKNSNYPDGVVISVGATSYTDFGKNNYLKIDDEVYVIVYDKTKYKTNDILNIVNNNDTDKKEFISILHQKIT